MCEKTIQCFFLSKKCLFLVPHMRKILLFMAWSDLARPKDQWKPFRSVWQCLSLCSLPLFAYFACCILEFFRASVILTKKRLLLSLFAWLSNFILFGLVVICSVVLVWLFWLLASLPHYLELLTRTITSICIMELLFSLFLINHFHYHLLKYDVPLIDPFSTRYKNIVFKTQLQFCDVIFNF